MKLLTLRLENFQAHKKLDVSFAPGITTIVGPTDRGKSAILRALGWVAQNNVGGDEFIREGATEARVTLVVGDEKDNEATIVRTKGRENSYHLDEKEYVAFGQSVPADIAKLLRLNEINFQGQHDSPFWFAETAGEVSRRLNAVIDLTIIDTTLSNIGAEVRRCQERVDVCEERLAENEKQLELITPQQNRVVQFRRLKEAHDTYTSAEKDFRRLDSLLNSINSNQAAYLQSQARALDEVFTKARTSVTADRRQAAMEELLLAITSAQTKATPPPDFAPVEKAFSVWQSSESKAETLRSLIKRINEGAFASDALAAALKATESKVHKMTQGKQCPICGNLIQ